MSDSKQTLLFELLCEELPPSSQKNMAEYLANNLRQALTDNKFVAPNENLIIYSTPRRLGLTISNVLSKSPDEIVEVKLMPINVGWQDDHASQPLLKKLEALDLLELKDSLTNFIIQDDTLYVKKQNKGQTVETFMQHQLPIILKQLPIEKTMSYQLDDGWQTVSFARPAVNLVCMHGDKILDINVLGLQGLSTATEAGVQDVQKLAKFIIKNKVKAIFIESSVPKRTIEALQEAVKSKGQEVIIGGTLYSDALGNAGTEEGTYVGMYKANVDTIVNALK